MDIKKYFDFGSLFRTNTRNNYNPLQYNKDVQEHARAYMQAAQVQNTINGNWGYQNPAMGVGGGSDVTASGFYTQPPFLSFHQLDNMYRTNMYAQRIINAPIEDMTRKWREFQYDDADIVEVRQEAEQEFMVREKVAVGAKYGDLYGGAGLLIVLKGEDAEKYYQPLDISRIKRGQLLRFEPVYFGQMNASTALEMDPTKENFGKPYSYTVNGLPSTQVHHTRLVLFEGIKLSLYASMQQMGFGDSKLLACYQLIEATDMTWKNITNLIARANIDVIGVKDFAQMAANDPNAIFKYGGIYNEVRNSMGMMIMDAEDDFKRQELSGLVGLSDLLMSYLQMLASAVPMPLTKFLGTGVGGFSVGDNEITEYYDSIHARQNKLIPQLKQIDEIVERHLFGDYKAIKYDWLSLREPAAAEKSSIKFQQMQADVGYMDAGVLSAEIIAKNLKQSGEYDALTDEFIAGLSVDVISSEDDAEFESLLQGSNDDQEAPEDTKAD